MAVSVIALVWWLMSGWAFSPDSQVISGPFDTFAKCINAGQPPTVPVLRLRLALRERLRNRPQQSHIKQHQSCRVPLRSSLR